MGEFVGVDVEEGRLILFVGALGIRVVAEEDDAVDFLVFAGRLVPLAEAVANADRVDRGFRLQDFFFLVVARAVAAGIAEDPEADFAFFAVLGSGAKPVAVVGAAERGAVGFDGVVVLRAGFEVFEGDLPIAGIGASVRGLR
jgi:hypothetical protein